MDRLYNCEQCGEFFELKTMLIRHKLKQHRKRQKVSVWLQEFDNETVYSSDSDCDYVITTKITRVPKIKVENYHIRVDNSFAEFVNDNGVSIKKSTTNYLSNTGINYNNSVDEKCTNQLELKDNGTQNLKSTNGFIKTENSHSITAKSHQLTCTECFNIFSNPNEILKHMRIKHRATFKQIADMLYTNEANGTECAFCLEIFATKNDILTHLKRIHRNELTLTKIRKQPVTGSTISSLSTTSLKCEPCATEFTRIHLYNDHRKECCNQFQNDKNDKEDRPITVTALKSFLCYICGNKYLSSNHLKIHMRKHTGERPFKCDICGRDFAIKKTWQDHAYTHSGIKPYKCTFEGCDKTFAHASGVRQHRICMHSQEKKFQCDHCQKLFSKKDHLLEHVRTHTGERPHECKLCGTKFKLSSTLRIHNRTHTGERPFRCKLCNKGFIKSYGLKQHLRTKRNCIPHQRDAHDDYTSLKNVELK